MKRAFNWFLGENQLLQTANNPLTGGYRDGVEEKNANINQGAESKVCYLMARILMEGLDKPVVFLIAAKISTKKEKLFD